MSYRVVLEFWVPSNENDLEAFGTRIANSDALTNTAASFVDARFQEMSVVVDESYYVIAPHRNSSENRKVRVQMSLRVVAPDDTAAALEDAFAKYVFTAPGGVLSHPDLKGLKPSIREFEAM